MKMQRTCVGDSSQVLRHFIACIRKCCAPVLLKVVCRQESCLVVYVCTVLCRFVPTSSLEESHLMCSMTRGGTILTMSADLTVNSSLLPDSKGQLLLGSWEYIVENVLQVELPRNET